ncbi:hypothetical protein [Streptomyces sp. NPDC051546]|uniref:hypothetical protein n=1 Tax=Streptomyces sp. NPDC051546 TaxID=3365655 RepID=UPI003795391F
MSARLKHGCLVYVVQRRGSRQVCLSKFVKYDEDDPGRFTYFETEFTHRPEEVEIVEFVRTVPRGG